MIAVGTCQHCGRQKRLDERSLVIMHMLAIDVSRRAITAVGSGRVRRRCSGSGRPPREATR